jgi:formylglycine-generating enzyme required for sulfatase activity
MPSFESMLRLSYSASACVLVPDRDDVPPVLPERLGKYSIRAILGEGGMGVVYLAEQVDPKRLVALKVLKSGHASSRLRRRFERETEILGRLHHPGIAQIFEAGTAIENGVETRFFAMELIRGVPLLDYAAQNLLGLEAKIRLMQRICDAVDHAHEMGVVHRDLKPGNILVAAAGQPKVLDFGVARALDLKPGADGIHTETGQLIGTIEYMSPEQFSGDPSAIGPSTDVYSLGVLAYQLLCGRLPYALEGKMIHESARIIRDQPPVPLANVEPKLHGDLQRVIEKALAKEKAHRYSSAKELSEDLERFLQHEPVLARPPALAYQLSRFVRRNRAAVVGIAGIIGALLLGVILASTFAVRESELRRIAEKQRDEILSLADSVRVGSYRKDAEALLLWPQTDAKLAAIESWLEQVWRLSSNLDLHRKRLEALRGEVPAGPELQWQQGLLSGLIIEIEELLRPGSGLRARLRRRLKVGRQNQPFWEEAVRSIGNVKECPAYQGLRIHPQDGLIPLGRNERSGLWEFLAPHPQAAQIRGAGGRISDPLRHGLTFILLPGGEFDMGSPPLPSSGEDELPQHRVTLDPFFISKYEVTQGQWRAVMGDSPSFFPGERLPVELVSWEECARFSMVMGLELPSEAQWEYACRAGTTMAYCFGDAPSEGQLNCSFEERFTKSENPSRPLTVPVDSFAPNAFGLHQVHGNVAEWCSDFQRGEFYSDPRSRERNPVCRSPSRGWRDRPLRGGSYKIQARQCRSSERHSQNARFRGMDVGFRPIRRLIPLDPDAEFLEDLVWRAEEIVHPASDLRSKVRDLETWLADAATLESRIRDRKSGDHERDGAREIAAGRLGEDLAAFLDPETGLRARLEVLCQITRRADELWARASRSIRDRLECPAYQGLEIEPQFGLVPLERDARSGLWTFAHFLGLERAPPASSRFEARQAMKESSTPYRFVLLPGGAFAMGQPEGVVDPKRSGPRREVTLEPFFIALFEVSQAQWRAVMGEDPSRHRLETHPVSHLSGHDCLVFSSLTGLELPTEAQWEYACRAGGEMPYRTGSALTRDQANFDDLCERRGAPYDESVQRTVPVDAFEPNGFGLYNVHGNVDEFCLVSEDPNSYRLDAVAWCCRGGGWASCVEDCRAWSRRLGLPGHRAMSGGFRPVRPVLTWGDRAGK